MFQPEIFYRAVRWINILQSGEVDILHTINDNYSTISEVKIMSNSCLVTMSYIALLILIGHAPNMSGSVSHIDTIIITSV